MPSGAAANFIGSQRWNRMRGAGARLARRGRELGAIVADAGARAELKAYLRIEGSDEDATLDRLLAVAIGHGEAFTGRLWPIRAARETLMPSAEWRRLGVTPVRSIDAVVALDLAGVATPLAPDAYAIDIDAAGDGWVRIAAHGVRHAAHSDTTWPELSSAKVYDRSPLKSPA